MYSRIYKQYDIFVKLINEILMKFSIIEVVVDISSCIHTAPYESMEDIKNKLNHIHIWKYTRGGVAEYCINILHICDEHTDSGY